MCGILFLFDEAANKPQLDSRSNNALQQLTHRGPDDEGVNGDENWRIGHKRLSIIDLSSSRQPMSGINQRYWLTYNGEIYNYKELRRNLEPHWAFRTNGDTEVLLAGLICHGAEFLQSLDGMFAFALWDNKKRKLLLARDRMGEKPLYYQRLTKGFACASELSPLRTLINTPWSQDYNSTADYLRYGYYLPGKTAYEQVFELLPGHYLEWDPDKGCEISPYWEISCGTFNGTYQEATDQLNQIFLNSIKSRMVSDVEIGVFLSGGIDSSLITSILSNHYDEPPKSFTIGFEDASYDETKYARIVAEACGTQHYEEIFKTWEELNLENLVLNNIGQPFSDESILPTSLVSELASKYVKVVLTGDGGDELFSGYQRYQARVILRWYTMLPISIRKTIGSVIKLLPEPVSHHSHSILKKAHLFIDTTERLQSESPYIAPVNYSEDNFSRLVPDICKKGHKISSIGERFSHDEIQQMMLSDALIYLPQDILIKVDRASMSHSLETRAPFLDKSLIEFSFSLPRKWHRSIFSGKQMLKNTFRSHLPKQIWARRKQGFGVPIHNWFRSDLGSKLEELSKTVESPVQTNYVMSLLSLHRSGKRDHSRRLWNIYIYLLWIQHAF